MASPDERQKKKRMKGVKLVTTDSVRKLGSQRTESPIFGSKENCHSGKGITQGRGVKYARVESHSRLLTEINDKLKVGSYSHLRTNSKNLEDRKETKKRSRLH